MKRDLLQQAYSAMRHDLRKTLLTMLGMAWGIATVVLLLAYGKVLDAPSKTSSIVLAPPRSGVPGRYLAGDGRQ